MGGGTSKLYPKRKKSIAKKDVTSFLFSFDSDSRHSTAIQGTGLHAEYLSDNRPGTYQGKAGQDDKTVDILTLFIILCYFLKEKYREENNINLRHFLDKLEEMSTKKKNNLVKSSFFKNFQKYCTNNSIKNYYGYEDIRNYFTKHINDTSGIFMNIKRNEWVQYVNQLLKNNNFRR